MINFDQSNPINAWAIQLVQSIRTPFLNDIAIYFTNMASPTGLTILAVIIAAVLWSHEKKDHMKQFMVTLLTGSILVGLIKIIVQLPRPSGALISESGYSFLSGHTEFAVTFFVLIAYSYKSHIKNKYLKIFFVITMLLIALLVGISRIYLGVHYFTDVFWGFVLGAVVSTVSILIFEAKNSK